ncbi:MAG: response regulator transcription factor [Bacillota bacterium]|nr:response regulator transcription factor [Bacillota bacterium]
MNQIRVLIADDQTLMRDGLKTILDLEDDIEVVDMAENGIQAYEKTKTIRPDVVLMDIRMPFMDGVESTKLIKRELPDTVVLILTTFDDDEYIIQALSNGASGYILKDIPGDKLINAVRDSINGNLMMPAKIAAKIAARLTVFFDSKLDFGDLYNTFSEREKAIISLLIKGLNNRQIAASLHLSEGTAKNYISAIYSKIGISDRTKAIVYLKEYIEKEK